MGKGTHTTGNDNAIKLKDPDVFAADPVADIRRQGAGAGNGTGRGIASGSAAMLTGDQNSRDF
ncbi:hypothetical protein DSCA_25850 [Desulfosarcina alkanivorans]|jgi:hypothetical protein|uniref:Uncharacterized protein n=1 Tax=Desulfosarcina alkanivorans TaxID=571177 RepID=A0A5K7YJS9_9BACT|nr:hypothetical protein DSCA_25850 [Desulfosarcina alkanivorans]